MSDINDKVLIGSGVVSYGSGLTLSVVYPRAQGLFWSYNGLSGSTFITPEAEAAIKAAGMKIVNMGDAAPLPPEYSNVRWLHGRGIAPTLDAKGVIEQRYGKFISDISMDLPGTKIQNMHTYANGGTFRPDLTYKTFSRWSGITRHFDETKGANQIGSRYIPQFEQYGPAISEVNAASRSMRVVGAAVRTGGGVLAVAGFGYDVYNTSKAVTADLQRGDTAGRVDAGREVAKFGGRWGGAAAGAYLGAYGYLAGPVVGTFTTIGGGLIGTFGGEEAIGGLYNLGSSGNRVGDFRSF